MRVLTYTTLFPNAERPRHGIFIETRLNQLRARYPVESKVVAPVPWFPSTFPMFGEYARHARVPREDETRSGIPVIHPRFPTIPKIGMNMSPYLMYAWTLGAVERVRRSGFDFDVIDAHYFYPDGVAAAMIARRLGKPLVITARGTDLNFIPRYAWPRRLIRWAANEAAAVVTVCSALKEALEGIGAACTDIRVLRNGVDLQLFRPPADRCALRSELDLKRLTLLSVGNLVSLKGHDLVIDALSALPDVDLIIVGEGEERARLEQRAINAGVDGRVRFEGVVPQERLRDYYGAADILVLASSREGWANVLLESMACGTPVIATAVCGTPEVVSSPDAGQLLPSRDSESIAQAVRVMQLNPPRRDLTRSYAEGFSWASTTDELWRLYLDVTQRSESLRPAAHPNHL